MMQFTALFTAASGRVHETLEALHASKREAQRVEGCIAVHIAADADRPNAFWYREDWLDVQALEAELRSDRFSRLLALMETCAKRPTVEFRLVTETRGLEYVAAVREGA
jgi:quinol monooxygenase YgiN